MLNMYETWNEMVSEARYKNDSKNDRLIDQKKSNRKM